MRVDQSFDFEVLGYKAKGHRRWQNLSLLPFLDHPCDRESGEKTCEVSGVCDRALLSNLAVNERVEVGGQKVERQEQTRADVRAADGEQRRIDHQQVNAMAWKPEEVEADHARHGTGGAD